MTSPLLLALTLSATLVATLATTPAPPQLEPEVRQLVTFKFLPGKTSDAVELFREQALPLYESTPPMLRFRGYREAESPEPLDLVVVSTFRGMEGMDASNRALREAGERTGTSIGALYGRIGALSEYHRDEFVELDTEMSWGDADAAPRVVLLSVRIEPGSAAAYEALVRKQILPWEKTQGSGVTGSDGGAFLLSDGWDYFRMIGITSLGDWHRYVREQNSQSFGGELDGLVSRSKAIILSPVAELSVR